MRNIILITLLLTPSLSFADTWVNGYTRSDGTYVQGHYRSSPNQYKYDNYGSKSKNKSTYDSPYTRDSDGDGIYNQYDYDDDNNGIMDDYE
jgi:hypothetical protein